MSFHTMTILKKRVPCSFSKKVTFFQKTPLLSAGVEREGGFCEKLDFLGYFSGNPQNLRKLDRDPETFKSRFGTPKPQK
jgi:hypothetical protein